VRPTPSYTAEGIPTFDDALLAQSAVDRLKNNAFHLVVDGESYRARRKPNIKPLGPRLRLRKGSRRSTREIEQQTGDELLIADPFLPGSARLTATPPFYRRVPRPFRICNGREERQPIPAQVERREARTPAIPSSRTPHLNLAAAGCSGVLNRARAT
jgi:hypothetical protein